MLNHSKETARTRDNASYLGYEYLTWLFLLIDSDEERLTALTKDLVFKENPSVLLGNKISMCLLNHKEQKTSVASPLLEESHEIFASLKNGHVVESLVITVGFGDYSIHLQLNASDFALTQVKLKNNYQDEPLEKDHELSKEESIREELFLRLNALDDLEKILDALFAEFLSVRLTNYSHEVARMRAHIEKRLEHLTHTHHDGSAHEKRPMISSNLS